MTAGQVQQVAQAADPVSPLLQYGLAGVVLAICMYALRAVYQQQIAQLNATILAERERSKELIAAERTRADRTEDRLNTLNEAVRDRVMVSMASSAEAFREALRALEGHR